MREAERLREIEPLKKVQAVARESTDQSVSFRID